jgi:hypothetical protein
MMFNPLPDSAAFETPPGAWKVRINTGSRSHGGVREARDACAVERPLGLMLEGKSVVVLSRDDAPSQ